MPLGPSQSYIVKYNGYQLPGYLQEESANFDFGVATSPIPFSYDGGVHQFAGIHNKTLSLRLKVWEQDHATCKNQIAMASTYLMSKRDSSGQLYVGYTDRYLWAMPKFVRRQADAATSVRTLEYEVEFDCRPYYIASGLTTVSASFTGSQVVTTSGRTLEHGTWTPVTITVTGTNVTISGYTTDSTQTGFISISGAVTDMVIDSEAYSATISGVNANDRMLWTDYQTYVGPGETNYLVAGTGSVSVSFAYRNRWSL